MHTLLQIMDANYHPNTNVPGATFGSQESSSMHEMNFQVSDFFELNDWPVEDDPPFSSLLAGYDSQSPNYTVNEGVVNSSRNSFQQENTNRDSGSGGKVKKAIREKVAFKTKSEVEILDDGFKWRKYGKKMVKNSPNPRNYYRCSAEGCPVKKRVERDNEDARYVVTTYEGVHNHQSPAL